MYFIEKRSISTQMQIEKLKLVIPNFNLLMQTESTHHLSCGVVGHNLFPTETKSPTNQEFKCSSCHAKVVSHMEDEFEYFPFKNNEINTILRHLFVLKLEHAKFPISA